MAKARPDRISVLMWMDMNRVGAAAAAAHFKGLPASTIRRWLTEAKQASAAPPGGERQASVPRAPTARSSARSRGPAADHEPAPSGIERSARPGLAAMDGHDQAHIVGFKRRALAFLDSDKALENPRAARDLIGALADLLDVVPDLLSMEARLAGDDDADGGVADDGPRGGGAAAELVRAALGGLGPADP
ncbi:MAG: hypothetical protein JNM72_12145 [Deltaproteobacteria bacterium]|nr:hypothetical protein [Deltaproteobacteria bacterium]